ncbi:hypothetical protein [Haloarchaeobius sp. TZWWS8]|uniref:hypothetical protein n=1 Tax=Haloarchaeobius sp. TZWWS8 TaxID=3446121 RepID=UPI003EB9AEDB
MLENIVWEMGDSHRVQWVAPGVAAGGLAIALGSAGGMEAGVIDGDGLTDEAVWMRWLSGRLGDDDGRRRRGLEGRALRGQIRWLGRRRR